MTSPNWPNSRKFANKENILYIMQLYSYICILYSESILIHRLIVTSTFIIRKFCLFIFIYNLCISYYGNFLTGLCVYIYIKPQNTEMQDIYEPHDILSIFIIHASSHCYIWARFHIIIMSYTMNTYTAAVYRCVYTMSIIEIGDVFLQ